MRYAIEAYNFSERRGCGLFGVARTGYRYQAKPKDDDQIEAHLRQLAEEHLRWGFEKMFQRLKAYGTPMES